MDQEQLYTLAAAAAKGDETAFAELCRERAKHILYICVHLMGNLQDGEDAAQEVFIRLQKSIRYLREPKTFVAWSNRIITNTCKNMLRANGRKRELALADNATGDFLETQPEFLPHEYAELAESRRAVLDALRTLPFKHRQVLVLFYYENLSTLQIASVLKTSPRAVEGLLYRARGSLRKRVEARLGPQKEAASTAGGLGGVFVLTRILRWDVNQPATNEAAAGLAGAVTASLAATGMATGSGIFVALAGAAASTWVAAGVTGAAAIAATVIVASNLSISGASQPPPPASSYVPQHAVGAAEDVPDMDTAIPSAASPGEASGGVPGGGEAAPSAISSQPPPVATTTAPPGAPVPDETDTAESHPADPGETVPAPNGLPHLTGHFVFCSAKGEPVDDLAPLASGFTVTAYSGGQRLARATADETGAFVLELSQGIGSFTVEVEPLQGLGPLEEDGFTVELEGVQALEEPLEIPFTDTQPPGAHLYFYDADGVRKTDNTNPAYATVAVYDATQTTVAWQVKSAEGAILSKGEGENIDLSALSSGGPFAAYTILCSLTDSAGNTAEVERVFVMFTSW